MAKACRCGTARSTTRLDPAECNTLTQSAAGLLVPATTVEGVAPGTAVGTERSVDVDVQAPAAGACPATWTVGARLTPVNGQTSGFVGLQASAASTFVGDPATNLLLPEAGTYELVADVQDAQSWSAAVSNAIIDARIFDVTAGVTVPRTDRRVILIGSNTTGANGIQANASCGALYTVTGPTTVQVQGSWRCDVGATTQRGLWILNFRFKKVTD